jgi:hypothetical protein
VTRRHAAEAVNALVNRSERLCYFESDGSLTRGFEIITQPLGLDKHAELWKWLSDSQHIVKYLRSHDTSTCGLHVHVSKAGLTKMQISKMVAFVNHPDNYSFIQKIARRSSSTYAAVRFDKKASNAYRTGVSRYEAVNLENRSTVEFRIFRGTLKYDTLMTAIEFVNALTLFCADTSGYGFKLTPANLAKFAESDTMHADTPHLRKFFLANESFINA